MNKPTPQTKEYYDYHQCSYYIAEKLGVVDLDDILGKFVNDSIPYEERQHLEYRCFWDFLLDRLDIHNGCVIQMPEYDPEYCKWEQWQIDVVNAFIEEFGEDAEYWVSW
jgi:hypothetical protein